MIPRFGNGSPVDIADCDPYFLFHDPEEGKTKGVMPYNPALLESLAHGKTVAI